jgi:heme o synthase
MRDFARVTKPGIMVLLLITTLGAMLIAAQGWPSLNIVLLTLLGGALASGGASSLNCYYDRDIDGLMARTRKRPIPTGGLTSDQVRAWGIILSVLSVIELAAFVNPLAALMALSGNVFYVMIYTRKLKRTTPQNIVIGGAAGSFPPLVGWAAVTGSLSLGAFLIAAIVFYWTPPHFWSLAMLKANDYRRAGIPMLPVTHGEHETRRRIVLYSFLLLAVTLLMVPAGVVGWIYGVTAAVLGAWFIIMAIRMFREDTSRLAWPLFKYSNYYLTALLAAMALDHFIRF